MDKTESADAMEVVGNECPSCFVPKKKVEFFDYPTQVKFWDPVCREGYIGGIGFRDYIICGCCGHLFEPKMIYDNAPAGVEAIVTFDWINISEELIGE